MLKNKDGDTINVNVKYKAKKLFIYNNDAPAATNEVNGAGKQHNKAND